MCSSDLNGCIGETCGLDPDIEGCVCPDCYYPWLSCREGCIRDTLDCLVAEGVADCPIVDCPDAPHPECCVETNVYDYTRCLKEGAITDEAGIYGEAC